MPTVNSFYIDKITNSIEDTESGKRFDTATFPVTKEDLRSILKKNGWHFNWRSECKQPNRQVFKLVLEGDNIVQGLVSLEPMDKFVEMHLLENAPHNLGPGKKYAGVAGNLVAFVCKVSFDLGFQGCIAFTAKTRLVTHYIKTLGAELVFGTARMSIFMPAAKDSVNSYYKKYSHGK